MKKIKFLGAAILAASLIFAGCANGSDDDVDSTPDTEKVVDEKGGEGSEENGGSESGSGEEAGGEENSGEGQNSGSGESSGSGDSGSSSGGESSGSGDSEDAGDGDSGDEDEDTNEYTAPDLTDYFKYELVSSPKNAATNKLIGNWGAGSEATPNDDGTWTITSSDSMWNGVGGICAPFTGFDAGTLANYDYIVFTVDTTDYEIDTADDGPGNKGVNIKVPEIQKDISSNYVANGNVRTYYAPMSLFETAPQGATEFAIIIGGSGTLKVNEVYFATTEDPASRAITGITITPTSGSLEKNGTMQFIVKDSNYVVRTEDVSYSLSGEAAAGSDISETGLLTVGTTAGSLTVTATYTVDGEDFTADATITVLGEMTNLITDIQFKKMYLAGNNWDCYVNNVEDVNAIPEDVNFSINDGVISFTTLKESNETYNTQLFLTTDADLHEGDEWYFSCKIGGVEGTWTIKLNDAEALIPLQTGSFTTEGSVVSFSSPAAVTAANVSENIVLFFAFSPSPAGTITISDIVLSKTN